jgi:putative ABC transport system permease protein
VGSRSTTSTAPAAWLLYASVPAWRDFAPGMSDGEDVRRLERRSEVGLRRALAATRRHVGVQFRSESLLLAALGGAAGVVLGAAVTIGYAASQDWQAVVPPVAIVGGVVAATAIGAVAGLYPALRRAPVADRRPAVGVSVNRRPRRRGGRRRRSARPRWPPSGRWSDAR